MSNDSEVWPPKLSRRVLVVEDDLASREFLRISLERKGYLVVPAESVERAQE